MKTGARRTTQTERTGAAREEDDVERSGGRDREKSSGHAETVEERGEGGLVSRRYVCEGVGVLERVGRDARGGKRRLS